MPSAFRRLAADHAVLHDDLPPNYLFPPDETSDDLTQLSILLAGPQGTPYTKGLWRLHLRMPDDYPKNPPKATFRTRIWHPNVEETTGAVCVDTLKRDWKTTLTLKDVLVTISCLLIYPNPDSALNSTAGALLQEDYGAFARQAKLMSSIHAPIPTEMKNAVLEAKLKGEDAGTVIQEQQEESHSSRSRKGTRVQSVTMKKKPTGAQEPGPSGHGSSRLTPQPQTQNFDNENDENDEAEDENMPSKENDPSLSPSPVKFAPSSPRKNALGKRPLSVLTMPLEHDPFRTMSATAHTPTDTDFPEEEDDNDDDNGRIMMTASEKNIAANNSNHPEHNYPGAGDDEEDHQPPQRKSPKLSVLNRSTNSSGRVRDDISYTNASSSTEDVDIGIFEDAPPPIPSSSRRPRHHRLASGDGKENRTGSKDGRPKTNRRIHPGAHTINPANNTLFPSSVLAPSTSASASSSTPASASASPAMTPSSLKGSSSSSSSSVARSKSATGARKVSSSSRQKPRIGIRRL